MTLKVNENYCYGIKIATTQIKYFLVPWALKPLFKHPHSIHTQTYVRVNSNLPKNKQKTDSK